MAYSMGKDMSRLSLHGIYYVTKSANMAKAKQSPTYKLVKGYDGFSATRIGPYCVMSGFVTGTGKTLGTLSKACRPKQKMIFDVATNMKGALVKINEAGVVELDLTGHVKGQKAKPQEVAKPKAKAKPSKKSNGKKKKKSTKSDAKNKKSAKNKKPDAKKDKSNAKKGKSNAKQDKSNAKKDKSNAKKDKSTAKNLASKPAPKKTG